MTSEEFVQQIVNPLRARFETVRAAFLGTPREGEKLSYSQPSADHHQRAQQQAARVMRAQEDLELVDKTERRTYQLIMNEIVAMRDMAIEADDGQQWQRYAQAETVLTQLMRDRGFIETDSSDDDG